MNLERSRRLFKACFYTVAALIVVNCCYFILAASINAPLESFSEWSVSFFAASLSCLA